MIIGCGVLARDDVKAVDDGDAAQVEEVLAGAYVADAAALPVRHNRSHLAIEIGIAFVPGGQLRFEVMP